MREHFSSTGQVAQWGTPATFCCICNKRLRPLGATSLSRPKYRLSVFEGLTMTKLVGAAGNCRLQGGGAPPYSALHVDSDQRSARHSRSGFAVDHPGGADAAAKK